MMTPSKLSTSCNAMPSRGKILISFLPLKLTVKKENRKVKYIEYNM